MSIFKLVISSILVLLFSTNCLALQAQEETMQVQEDSINIQNLKNAIFGFSEAMTLGQALTNSKIISEPIWYEFVNSQGVTILRCVAHYNALGELQHIKNMTGLNALKIDIGTIVVEINFAISLVDGRLQVTSGKISAPYYLSEQPNKGVLFESSDLGYYLLKAIYNNEYFMVMTKMQMHVASILSSEELLALPEYDIK